MNQFRVYWALRRATILEPLARATAHHGLGRCIWWGRGARRGSAKHGADWSHLPGSKNSSRTSNFSYEKVQLRKPIAQHLSQTTCHSAAHLEEVEEADSEAAGAASPPVEVCSSAAAALQEL
jgi:hypothetical protein